MIYKYELWDEYPLEGEYKGIQINEIPVTVVINAWVNGQILLSDCCLKMLVVELQEIWDNNIKRCLDELDGYCFQIQQY